MRPNYCVRHLQVLQDIAEANTKRRQADRDLRAAVRHARLQDASWEDIAAELGTTSQQAEEEFNTDWGRLGWGL
jgi:hypothetical protein